MYHFSWLVDYIQEDHGLLTIQHNVTGEQHGKGTSREHLRISTKITFFAYITTDQDTYRLVGPWDAEGGGAKSFAEALSEAGQNIATAFDLYTHLQQHHSAPTNSYHKSLHQIAKLP